MKNCSNTCNSNYSQNKNQKLKLMLTLTLMLFILAGCSLGKTDKQASTEAVNTENNTSSEARTESIVATSVQLQTPRYITIDEVGVYNPEIITPNLLESYNLPAASKNNVPYWTGLILENKISVNYNNPVWNNYTAGPTCFAEEELKYFHDNGFNAARVLYSMSFFSNPDDISSVNVSELEQLDELIAWGMKNDIHIMISITGLPGKWNTSWEEEGVQSNYAIFADKAMQDTFHAYWKMLSKRYAEIPTDVLSFEMLAEPAVVDYDINLYAKVMAPIVQDLWLDNENRIIIVNDVGKQIPVELAKIGCDLSLHTHIYTVDESRLEEWGVKFDASWPMMYLPGSLSRESGELVLESENGFSEGEVTVYYEYYNSAAKILADGKTIYKPVMNEFVNGKSHTSATFPEGTKKLVIAPQDEATLVAVTIKQKGKDPIAIPTHSLYGVYVPNEPLPSILIKSDGSLVNVGQIQYKLDSEYFTKSYLQGFIDCAKENGVSFLMTEVGTDTDDLTSEAYVAYHSEWLKALRDNQVSWMYNCVHNILAPEPLMWLNKENSAFTDFSDTDIPKYKVNNAVMELLKSYSK